jgi:hypothetical protein
MNSPPFLFLHGERKGVFVGQVLFLCGMVQAPIVLGEDSHWAKILK